MRSAGSKGFSLLELLVVLVIIGVLIAILIPTLSAVRRRSKITVCASNLRQIGQAVTTYRAEQKRWPKAAAIPEPFTYPGELATPGLPEVMAPYLPRKSAVYHCPGDERDVFDQIAAVGDGISYMNWIAFALPKPHDTMMTDFQGYGGPLRSVHPSQFHPPRVGMNELKMDGSVDFGQAQPADAK